MSRLLATTALLAALLPGSVLAQRISADTQALPELPVGIRTQALPTGAQTGQVDLAVAEGATPITIRSFQPDSVDSGAYRVAFAVLDINADGFIDRDEATVHAALNDEFKALDVKRRGKLDRADLAGWLID
jgi:hypothetical protein